MKVLALLGKRGWFVSSVFHVFAKKPGVLNMLNMFTVKNINSSK